MAGILGGKKNASATVRYQQMNLQTSAQGVCIAIHYGRNRVAPNLIWYGGFTSKAVKQKDGKGGGSSTNEYDYFADIIMALCEGVVSQVFQVYKGQTSQTLATDGMALFGGEVGQPGWSYLEDNYPTQYSNYSGTAYIVVAKLALGTSPDLPSYGFEVAGNLWNSIPGLDDVNPADCVYDYITNAQYGLAPGATWIDQLSLNAWRNYCGAQGILFSPYMSEQEQVTNTLQRWAQMTNTFIFWSGNTLKFVPLGASPLAANGYTYNPQIQPLFSFSYDDLLAESKGKEPLQVTRVDPADGYNQVQLDIRDRNNAYNNTSIYWSDPASVNQYGQLMANIIQANEICLQSVGVIAAQLLGQRSVYIRNTYTFKLGYQYCILEPGDIVEINEPNIGLVNFPVRIQSVSEGSDELLTITAEEFPYSVGQAAVYAPQASLAGPTFNVGVDPGLVNPPGIIEPPASLTGNVPEVWISLSGGPQWGGAFLWISFDNGENYNPMGSVSAPSTQGMLVASLPAVADPDTTDTLAVDLTISDSSLPSTATHADADAFRTLVMVDKELMSYGTVALGGTSEQYDLTYLRRGVYGSNIEQHDVALVTPSVTDTPMGTQTITVSGANIIALGRYINPGPGMPPGVSVTSCTISGSNTVVEFDQPTTADIPMGTLVTFDASIFTRIDANLVYKYTLPPQYVGKTLFFKFTSFNAFGNNEQDISDVVPYVYTPIGQQYTVFQPTGVTVTPGLLSANLAWTPGPSPNTEYYEVYYSTTDDFTTATLTPGTFTGASASIHGLTPSTVYYFWVVAVGASNVSPPSSVVSTTPFSSSDWIIYTHVTLNTSVVVLGRVIVEPGGLLTLGSSAFITLP